MKRLFTSESVTEGHPDKLCDYISDSILDSYLAKDKNARVACETVAGKGEIFITGEITSTANVDIEQVVRDTIKEVGYADSEYDIDYRTCKIYINLSKQSPDIALGVDKSLEDKEGKDVESEGAGDQGLMFGYACDETEELMPLPISLAHKLSKRLTEVRKEKIIDYLRPDGKTQVTVEYDGDKPVRVDTIVVSTQHLPDVDMKVLKKDIIEKVIKPTVPANLLDENTKYFINPTGRFVIGGPLGDSGLTGRKIIVDTYGGAARHGGGAFSGKDPTKVDRSASYMARHIAKILLQMVMQKMRNTDCIQHWCGKTSVYLCKYLWNKYNFRRKAYRKIDKTFDLTPRGIINYLDLQRPIYRQTTNYGHFGKKTYLGRKL